jgi:hypothetical protein
MKNLVHFALSVLFLLGIASAQNIPAVDVFGGYSGLDFQVPTSGLPTSQQRLKLNGWEFSASVFSFHHLALEGDFSDHWLNNCGGTTLKCDDFSWGLGPRFTIGDRSRKLTGFVHGLIGQDTADILGSGVTVSNTSMALAAGGGGDYWLFRHVGLQFGPVDYVFARHLNSFGAANQSDFRVAGGIAFRFGGNFPPPEPKAPKEPKARKEPKAKSESHRSWKRPWHKTKSAPSEGQPSETPAESQSPVPVTSAPQPARRPASVPASAPSRGMPVHPLGIVAAPQEFDGAKVLSIEPGSVAEMASLKPGDLIKSVDGKAVRTPMELAAELADKTGKVRIGILRGTFATETVILLGGH